MIFRNFHSHSMYDDGELAPEEYVYAAIKKGMKTFGFSGHAPLPFPTKWCIKSEELNKYFEEIQRLKKKFAGEIEIYSGLEADYIKNVSSPSLVKTEHRLDYVIGAVHLIWKDDILFEIDGTFDKFKSGFETLFSSNPKSLVDLYCDSVVEMIYNHTPDILAHFDKVKMYLSYFFPSISGEKWFLEKMISIIEAAKEKDICIEVNTRGFYKGYSKETYPSEFLLKEMKNRSMRICLNSDAHHPSEIFSGFDETIRMLKEIGFNSFWDVKI